MSLQYSLELQLPKDCNVHFEFGFDLTGLGAGAGVGDDFQISRFILFDIFRK
jgi:hypothetical protein